MAAAHIRRRFIHPPRLFQISTVTKSYGQQILRRSASAVNCGGCVQPKLARIVAVFGATLGWSALGLQLVLTLAAIGAEGGTILDGVWRYLGYFTIIANLLAATVLSLALVRPAAPRIEFAAVTTMILVGVVYSLLLRETWDPQGWQKIADVALHDFMPLTVAAFWLLRRHGGVGKKEIAASLILPLTYCAYAMVRGAMDGWYAYGFLDVTNLGAGAVALNCAGLSLAFLAMAVAMAWVDRVLHYRQV